MKISGAHKAMKRVLIFLVTLGIIVPILFTAGQMGLFSPEPTVEIEAGITSESAPVLQQIMISVQIPITIRMGNYQVFMLRS